MNFRKIPGIAEECIYVFQGCKRVAAAGKVDVCWNISEKLA